MKNILQTSKNTSSPRKRVFVGLSGGVDSAVSAALLIEQGYDVTGVFIKVWQPSFLECTWREERRDAMRVADKLNIPFLFFDFEEEYKRGVADYMIEEYKKGRTPNPDVMCNREIKFGAFWKKAKELGADYIATGHYARVENGDLLEGLDENKDQSYFLWMLTKDDLRHVMFPIGGLKKEKVREMAIKFGIPNALKKDSQGICFLGDVDIEEFLSHFIDTKPGNVIDVHGEIIGRHNGALYYTLGERHGFDVDKKSPNSKPYFVVGKDLVKNTITVTDDKGVIDSNMPNRIVIEETNWISEPESKRMEARVRYRQEKISVIVEKDEVTFDDPQIATPGQSIVFYKGDLCLGGAIIK